MQNLGGQAKSIMVFSEVAYRELKQRSVNIDGNRKDNARKQRSDCLNEEK